MSLDRCCAEVACRLSPSASVRFVSRPNGSRGVGDVCRHLRGEALSIPILHAALSVTMLLGFANRYNNVPSRSSRAP